MMRKWCQILPYFVVVWLAKRHGERFASVDFMADVVSPYTGHSFVVDEDK